MIWIKKTQTSEDQIQNYFWLMHNFIGKQPSEAWLKKFEVFYDIFIDELLKTNDKETIFNIICILRKLVDSNIKIFLGDKYKTIQAIFKCMK